MFCILQGEVYQAPICLTCNDQLDYILREQDRNNLARLLCHHAKVAANIIRDFKNPVTLDGWLELSEDDDESSNVEIIHRKEEKATKTQHLAVSLLYTTGKQVTPTCSSCSSVSCQCVRSWKKHFKDASIEPVDDDLITNGLEGPDDALREDAHYLDTEAQYGHNDTKIKFPLPTCPNRKSVLETAKWNIWTSISINSKV